MTGPLAAMTVPLTGMRVPAIALPWFVLTAIVWPSPSPAWCVSWERCAAEAVNRGLTTVAIVAVDVQHCPA
ncbi:hypothetical protein ACIBG4_02395 [Nonomuraea sp. NPDC050383]|uniref:hypothetical protein n=1 Tax=Nonomuraea sp. NPDC050383 TaxID=3364362 RepID=UPI0037A5ADC6